MRWQQISNMTGHKNSILQRQRTSTFTHLQIVEQFQNNVPYCKIVMSHNIIQRLRDAGEICVLDGLDVVCLWDCFNNTHNSLMQISGLSQELKHKSPCQP